MRAGAPPCQRRFRPAHLLDPRLSGWQGAGAAARHERLSGLAGAQLRRPPKPGSWLVAKREWRWLLHDRVALILIFGVPLFAFVVLSAAFSHPVVRDLGVVVVDADRSEVSRAFVEQVGGLAESRHRRAHRRSGFGGVGDSRRRSDCGLIHPGQLRT